MTIIQQNKCCIIQKIKQSNSWNNGIDDNIAIIFNNVQNDAHIRQNDKGDTKASNLATQDQ